MKRTGHTRTKSNYVQPKPSWIVTRRFGYSTKRLSSELPDLLTSFSVRQFGQRIKEEAKDKAFNKNVPVTFLEGNTIVRVYKSGEREVLKQLKPVAKIELPDTFEIRS